MKRYIKFLTLLMTSAVWMIPAWGQTVYKCGQSYSQQPCPGATIIDASDVRSAAQQAHAEAATRSTDVMAAKLEKERLLHEKVVALKSSEKQTHPVTGVKTAASVVARKTAAHKKKEPEYFTATASVEKKEKKAEKKPTDDSQVAKANKAGKTAKVDTAGKDDLSVKP